MESYEESLKMIHERYSTKDCKRSGCSVTQRVRQVKQPRGGYLNPKNMAVVSLGEGIESLNPNESVHPSLVGLAVDYLTRLMLGETPRSVFLVALLGASVVNEKSKANKLIENIIGLDAHSVVNAVKLCGYDACARAGAIAYKPVDEILPDNATVNNIITMVKRSLLFFKSYGPKVLDGFTFRGGYTEIVCTGDGDFTTEDTLWDFKVSKAPIKKEQTLQLLMYWRMGIHSIHSEFQSIKYLGIYNPRLNTVSRIAVSDISADIIKEVETIVIGYN